MISDPIIEHLKIIPIEIKFDHDLFKSDAVKSKIKALLPSTKPQNISFHLKQANTSIANALRRVVQGELLVKILTLSLSDIKTDEVFIKKGELIDRINYIPIDQNIDLSAEWSLNIAYTESKDEYMVVHSRDMIQTKGIKIPVSFAETFRLAELRLGKYLIIPKIKVKEDYGFNGSAHCLTTQVVYEITDFICVDFVNERANFVSKRIKVAELLVLFKKYKIKSGNVESEFLFRKKILIIPNASYQKQLTVAQKSRINKYDIVVENTESISAGSDDKFLKEYASTETKATEFFLSVTTYGNIDPKVMMVRTCDNIVERLLKLQTALAEKPLAEQKTEGHVTIVQDNIKTMIIIRGEDYTIAQLLKITIFELDPEIGLVTSALEHPLNRTIILVIKHAQPLKILDDAINKNIGYFKKLAKYFS